MDNYLKKYLCSIFGFLFLTIGICCASEPIFYQKLHQLGISTIPLLKSSTLPRYELTRLLNAVQCHDCIIPEASMRQHYNASFWRNFILLPGKDFRDIPYLSGNFLGKNYYYCVASVGEHDIMRGYPLATSNICAGKFCGERNVSKGEFFQTLTNLLADKVKSNYSASRKAIKNWLNKQNKRSYTYKVFTTEELKLIEKKSDSTEKIATRSEFTTYLKYCMFNPYECGFQTFDTLGKGVWPLSELNVLIQAGIITSQDISDLSKPISPKEALERLALLYDLHTQCEINTDYDCDGILNHEDNCPYTYNPSQNDLDANGIGDVCDDDIDGDGVKNPVGLVDDTGNINYRLLKYKKSDDLTPLGSSKKQGFFSIKVNSLSTSLPSIAKIELISQEEPLSVEWDFGDLIKGKGRKTQHIYTTPGIKTITAKVTTKDHQHFLISQQLYIGESDYTSYALSISLLEINNQNQTVKLEVKSQGKFDILERGNTANQSHQKGHAESPITLPLVKEKRNNITLKGYAEGKLVAVASLDILDQDGKFFGFSPIYTPLLKTLDNEITTILKLNNLSLSSIESIGRDFGDGTNFIDKKLVNRHTYTNEGEKILIQKIRLKNKQELISSSLITINNPKKFGNQVFNFFANENNGDYQLSFQEPSSSQSKIALKSFLNGTLGFSSDNLTSGTPLFILPNRKGVVKIRNKILASGTIPLENKSIFFLGNTINLNTNSLFSNLKCDSDQDGIPDFYDDDIDGDGVKNLLGMILYERDDCKLVIGENVDIQYYHQHFGVCSLDNCPFSPNPNQTDLNLDGVGDQCEEQNGGCGNGKIDPGEDCKNCPQDVGPCTARCGNGKVEPAEDCKNCPQDVPNCDNTSCGNGKIDDGEDCKNCPQDVGPCTAFCGNGKAELAETCTNCPQDVKVCKENSCGNNKIDTHAGEQCDNGNKNGKDGKCSLYCSLIDPKKPLCGNGKIDPNENCTNCPQDLKDICIDSGKKECGNGKIDDGEDCKNCPQDLKDICIDSGKKECGNGKIDLGETCNNCPQDVPNCDNDEDGCPDATDPCPNLPGINGGCCPDLPTPCEGEDCPLVNPICNKCPCHYADYSNTLQKNDQVRARLRDQSLQVHYNYSPFVRIKDFLKFSD